MKPRPFGLLVAIVLCLASMTGQTPSRNGEDYKLPNGKSQRDEILKSEYDQSLKDVTELSRLVEDLKSELEKNDSHVLSVNSLKQLDEIEKLTKRIRSRLKRF